jgi:RNA polymerase sigma-70 factor (ECF subfamily)
MPLDQTAVITTVMQWRQKLTAAAWLVVRDTHAADDIFQTVVLKALSSEAVFDADAAVVSWSFITCRNASIDWLRRRRKETSVLEANTITTLHDEWARENLAHANVRTDALEACLGEVPEQARLLIRLRYADGLACGEVAARLGLNLDAVYKRLSRLHLTLRQCVEGKLALEGSS